MMTKVIVKRVVASNVTWSCRLFAAKTPNRAAVHGLKQQPTHTLQDREKIEQEIDKTKEEQGNIRKEVEDKVDSQLKKHDTVESPESLSSS